MSKKSSHKLTIAIFIFIFIIIYLIYLLIFYLIPNKISFVLILGFLIVIIGFFLFITLESNKENKQLFGFKFISENLIKIILVISMIIAFFIPPVSFTTTIMDWSQIGINNYIRAFIFIVGCAFLPGACAFNIMFPKNEIHEKFKVGSFILKITFYPIFSFVLIAISVLILDVIGLIREYFAIVLFIMILTLFFLNLLVQFLRDKDIFRNNLVEIKISKHTFYILIIALGYALFTIGVQITMEYLIPGDAWVGLGSANFIGNPDVNPNRDIKFPIYPSFWGYIIFGLANLSGIPYINLNVLLTPFSYLSVTSMYLFIKSILRNHKGVYAVLATIFVSMFAGIFYLAYNELGLVNISIGGYNPSSLRFALDYKNFAYILFNFSMGLFITSFKTSGLKNRKFNVSNEEFKILFLSSLFLLMSYMIYVLPLIAGIYIPFLYCLFSETKIKKQKFQSFILFLFLFLIFFTIFDILKEFSISFMLYHNFLVFVKFIIPISKGVEIIWVVYGILWSFFIFMVIFQLIYSRFFYKMKKRFLKFKIKNTNFIFFTLLTIITILLVIEIYNTANSYTVYEFIYKSDNKWYFVICNSLNHMILNIGIIGILGIYLSYFCFKIKRNLFHFLISWIICTLFISLIVFFLVYVPIDEIITNTLDIKINSENYKITHIWFGRAWVYSIPAFSILASIGFINLEKKLKNLKFMNRNFNFNLVLKLSIASILIFSSYSSIIVEGSSYNSDGKTEDAEAQVIGWITKEIPLEAHIIGERSYKLERLIYALMDQRSHYFSFNSVFKDEDSYENEIQKLKDNKIQYAIFYDGNHPGLSLEQEDFIDNYLIPKIYYKVLYKYKGLVVYYAPDLEDDVERELAKPSNISSINNTEVGAEQINCIASITGFNNYNSTVGESFYYENATLTCDNNFSQITCISNEYSTK